MNKIAAIKQCCPENIDPVQDLGRLIAYLRSNLVSHIDTALAPMDLTAAQYMVVVLLAQGQICTLVELCDHMVYDRGAMSRLLNRLEEKGLVTKTVSSQDRRSTHLKLTDKGQQLFPQILPMVNGIYQTALKDFSAQEQMQLAQFMLRAINNLKA